jgi:hypothetical protein
VKGSTTNKESIMDAVTIKPQDILKEDEIADIYSELQDSNCVGDEEALLDSLDSGKEVDSEEETDSEASL